MRSETYSKLFSAPLRLRESKLLIFDRLCRFGLFQVTLCCFAQQ